MKQKICITPVSVYHREAMQDWLEKKAEQGLVPTNIGRFFSIFEPMTDENCAFHLEPRDNDEDDVKHLKTRPSDDWTFVCNVSNTFFLFSAKRNTPKPDCDAKLRNQYARWEKVGKKYIWYTFTPIILVVVQHGIRALGRTSRYDDQADLMVKLPLVILEACHPLIVSLFFVLILGRIFKNLQLRTLVRASEQHTTPKPRGIPQQNAMILVLWVVVAGFGIRFWIEKDPMPLSDFSEPYISLSAIEDKEMSTWQEVNGDNSPFAEDTEGMTRLQKKFSERDSKMYNEIINGASDEAEYLRSILAFRAYNIGETCYGPIVEGEEFRYKPTMNTTYFHLVTSALSRSMAESKMDDFQWMNGPWETTELEYEGLDFVILAHEDLEDDDAIPYQVLAIGKGSRVAVFEYRGYELLEEHLDILAELVIT